MSTEILKTSMAESCEDLEDKPKAKHKSIFDDYHGETKLNGQEIISTESYDTIPIPTPKFAGEDLHLNSNLVKAGFSAISIKHQPQYQRFSKGCRWMAYPHSRANMIKIQQCHNPKSIQPRNSYPALHHPELMNLKWVRALNPNNRKEVIEKFLHEHTTHHGLFCSSLHCSMKEKKIKTMPPHQMISEFQVDSISSPKESILETATETDHYNENEFTKTTSADNSENIAIPITGLLFSGDLERMKDQVSGESMDSENHQIYRRDTEVNHKCKTQLDMATQDKTELDITKYANTHTEKGATARLKNSFKEVCNEKDKKKGNETEEVEIIVAPIPRTEYSIENVLLVNAPPSEEFLDIQDLRRGTGSGEDELNCTEPLYDEEEYQNNSETQVTEVLGEAGALVHARGVTEEERNFHKALRKSPAKMHITVERECCHPGPWVVENKEMAPYKSLQEVVKKTVTEENCGGNHVIFSGENTIIGSYFSTHETTPAERSMWQISKQEWKNTTTAKDHVNYDNSNQRESMESIRWERGNE